MIWANPWAWLGLAALAVPILIHRLARETSEPVPFPTLRFLRDATLVEVRRKRLTDFALLAVRCAMLALAAAALAQPFTAARTAAAPQRLVIVDASPSVDAGAARAAVRTYSDAAQPLVIERASLSDGLREAAGWAAAAPSASIVVISDFQRGALDPAQAGALPPHASLTLHRVARRDLDSALHGVSRLEIEAGRTSASWSAAPAASDAIRIESAHGGEVARAMAEAARATAAAHGTALHPATFVLTNAPNRQALADGSAPANAPWMYDVIAAITPGRAQTVKQIDGRAVIFLATTDAATATDAIREAIPALAIGPAPSELERVTLSDEELQRLERVSEPRPALQPDAWAGRWLWIAALALLIVETVMRRGRRREGEELARAA